MPSQRPAQATKRPGAALRRVRPARLWVRASRGEERALAWVARTESLARGVVLRKFSLETVVAMYEARPGNDRVL